MSILAQLHYLQPLIPAISRTLPHGHRLPARQEFARRKVSQFVPQPVLIAPTAAEDASVRWPSLGPAFVAQRAMVAGKDSRWIGVSQGATLGDTPQDATPECFGTGIAYAAVHHPVVQ